MSHFTVLVIGQNPEKQLQPFHEFECTGEVDQFVQSVDQLQEAIEGFSGSKKTKHKAPDGTLHEPHGDQFYREMTEEEAKTVGPVAGSGFGSGLSWYSKDWGDGLGYRAKIHFLPEGWEKVELQASETQTFAEYVADYYDRPLLSESVEPDLEGDHKWGWYRTNADGDVIELINRTNPNKKWDWYQLGGRWSGFFKMKPRTSAVLGTPGLMTPKADDGTADQAFKIDIDFDGMRSDAEAKAAIKYDEIRAIIGQHLPAAPWPEMLAKYHGDNPVLEGGIDAARKAYRSQPAVQALGESEAHRWDDIEPYLVDRAEFIRLSGLKSCSTFAVLKDGVWHERGQMGWWACVSDEKDDDTWLTELGKLIGDLPDDTLLSVYDCHI